MVTEEEWMALQEQEFNFLESLKLPAGFFDGYVSDVMNFIEDAYEEKYQREQKIKDPFIFNTIGEYDFMDWVYRKYKIANGEEIRYYFIDKKVDENG